MPVLKLESWCNSEHMYATSCTFQDYWGFRNTWPFKWSYHFLHIFIGYCLISFNKNIFLILIHLNDFIMIKSSLRNTLTCIPFPYLLIFIKAFVWKSSTQYNKCCCNFYEKFVTYVTIITDTNNLYF